MSILVSPAEPATLRSLGASSTVPEAQYGADFLIAAKGFTIGVQRKEFPGDFLSSLSDGRLGESVVKLTKTTMPVLLLEGKPRWTFSGQLLGHDYGQGRQFLRSQLRGLLFTMQNEFGVAHHWTDDVNDSFEFLRELDRWGRKDKHDSLLGRPGVKGAGMRKRVTDRDHAIHLLQGFQGVGAELAGRIYDHFGGVPLHWSVTADEFLEIEGLGPVTVDKLMARLKGVPDNEHGDG
jgi:ERCC4-type nuclease